MDALESAYELDHSTNTLRQILAIHEATGDTEALADVTARIEAQIAENAMTKTHAKRSRTSTSTRRPTAKRSAQSGTRTRKQI